MKEQFQKKIMLSLRALIGGEAILYTVKIASSSFGLLAMTGGRARP